MILCLDKSYSTFLWFFCPRDSLIHFRPNVLCIKWTILRLNINNTGRACPINYMCQALHFKKRFLWSKHICVIQLRTNNIWELLQIISTIQGEAKIFFSKLNLVIMSMIESERLFSYVTFVLDMSSWWCPFFTSAQWWEDIEKSPNFWQTSTDQISGRNMGYFKHLCHIRLNILILKGGLLSW